MAYAGPRSGPIAILFRAESMVDASAVGVRASPALCHRHVRHGCRGHEDGSGFHEYYGVNPGRRDHAYHAVGHAVCPGCAALRVRGSIRLSVYTVLVDASEKPSDELRCL